MRTIQIYYQAPGYGDRYVGLTLEEVAIAMHKEWTRQIRRDSENDSLHVRITLGKGSDAEHLFDINPILLSAPFGEQVLSICEGHDGKIAAHGLQEMYPDEMGTKEFPTDARRIEHTLRDMIPQVYFDEDGLVWCKVKGCIETYIDSLPPDTLDVTNNY